MAEEISAGGVYKMWKLLVGLIALLVMTTGAEARHRHHHVRDTGAVWNWNHTGFWQPIPGTLIEHRTTRHRRHFARPQEPRHARVRLARHHRILISKPAPTTVFGTEPGMPGSGVVQATSGAVAYVAAHATEAFQCVVTELEAAGYRITEMGGFARGGHIRGSLHYRGLALDVNQQERNVTVPPMPKNEIQIANGCGLISGAQWAGDPDSGHFQLGGWAGLKGNTKLASLQMRHRIHHRRHYARRHRDHRYAVAH